jgi:RimJ/RimL family protein N-acetyltransferase
MIVSLLALQRKMESPLSNLGNRISHLWRVKIVRFERQLKNCATTLRLYRLKDVPVLYSLFDSEIFFARRGIEDNLFKSSFSFWRWMINTFYVVYVIEALENRKLRIIGLAGLYKIEIGKSLWLSLAIFNPQDRKRGHGQQALELLLNALKKNGLVETVYCEVLKINMPSLCFFRKLGFEICGRYPDRFFMEKNCKA